MTEDHLFALEVYTKSKRIYLMNNHTYLYRQDRPESSINANKKIYYDDMEIVQEKISELDFKHKKIYYERFINYEFKIHGINRLLLLGFADVVYCSHMLKNMLNRVGPKFSISVAGSRKLKKQLRILSVSSILFVCYMYLSKWRRDIKTRIKEQA